MPNPIKWDYKRTGLIDESGIAKLKDSMLPSLFAANYELRHIAAEDVIFTNPVTGGDVTKVEQSNHCHIDAAYDGSDYTAFTMCRKVGETYYVLGKLWRKHVDDCEDEIISIHKKFNAGRVYVETNADKGYLAKDLRKRGLRVIDYAESTNKFIKITSYLKAEWKNVVFVAGTDKEYIEQVTEYNENADHDDAPDSLASIIRVLWGKKEEPYKTVIYK
jgi:predicted phage terminase large subunit-like protein